MNMTFLKPLMVTACYCARYFAREEQKVERVKQAVQDAELLLKEMGIPDPTVTTPAPAPSPAPVPTPVPGGR